MGAPELQFCPTPPRLVKLAAGITALVPAVYVDPDHEGLTVRVMVDVIDGKLRPTHVAAHAHGEPVTGHSLRSIRVAEVFEAAIAEMIHVGEPTNGGLAMSPISLAPFRLADEDPAEYDLYERVAAVFRAADACGLPPQKLVMSIFDAPRSTAGYWIKQARARGYLEPSERSIKKEEDGDGRK